MSNQTAPIKDPNSILIHGHDWTAWLDGEAITAFTVTSDNPALIIDQTSEAGGIVRYRVRGGVLGETHRVTSRVTTNTGRSDDYSLRYRIQEK